MPPIDRRWRAGLTRVLAIYGFICLRSPGGYRWLDGEHDWAALLGQWRLMSRDGEIADAVHLLGVLIYLAAIAGGWLLLRYEPQKSLRRSVLE
ncbi:MAG: hypothetical protein ABIZ96_09470 [Gemmatimonadales bacterium]